MAKFIPTLVGAAAGFVLGGPLGAAVGAAAGTGATAASGGFKKATPAALAVPLPQAQRDDAAAMDRSDDELRRRRGSAADLITGPTGAEAPLSGGKLVLGA